MGEAYECDACGELYSGKRPYVAVVTEGAILNNLHDAEPKGICETCKDDLPWWLIDD